MTIMPEHTKTEVRPGILVVDDTPINLQLLTCLLKERGYRPRPVTSGKAALAAAQSEPPDLVLLDISMPEMNGYTVCERFKADPLLKDIPILFLSALSDIEDKIRGLKVGGADFITKPFRIEEIEARINAHLRVRTLQRQLLEQNVRLEEIVAERTRQLDEAYTRLKSLDRVKGEFLLMLAHEMRTPSNGVLGVGELVLELCPPSAELEEYKDLFHGSKDRLIRLLDDVSLLTHLETNQEALANSSTSYVELLNCARHALHLPRQTIAANLPHPLLRGETEHLLRALTTALQLAACFCKNQTSTDCEWETLERSLIVRFNLDALLLKPEECSMIFDINSEVRTRSAAEPLGLAPVVTHRLLQLMGGDICLESVGSPQGRLVLVLPLAHPLAPASSV